METLSDRVAQAAEQIISEKRERGSYPLSASAMEIAARIADASRGDIVDAMRRLHLERRYVGRIDIAKTPLLTPKE